MFINEFSNNNLDAAENKSKCHPNTGFAIIIGESIKKHYFSQFSNNIHLQKMDLLLHHE